jgi:hypothetical protein
MRLLTLYLVLAVAGCATSATNSGQAPVRAACDQRTNCFNQRTVRAFQVLDDTTMIVFVGAERCPFRLKVDGFFCSLRSSAFLSFQDLDGEICNLDRSYIVGGPFARDGEDCRIREVEPLNDDELVETFAAYGLVEPLPTSGSGELEVVEEASEGEAVEGEAAPAVENEQAATTPASPVP